MTEPETLEDVKTQPSLASPWNVIVHDDPVTTMTFVTQVFMSVLKVSHTKAEQLMLEVHNSGRSIVWTGGREQAEFIVLRLQGFTLLTTLERVVT